MALIVAFENVLAMILMPFLAIVSVISFYRYSKYKYPHFLYMALDWSGMFIWVTLTVISTIMGPLNDINMPLATLLGFIGYFTLLGTTIFLVLFVDFIHRISIDPLKIGIFGLLAATVVITALEPGQAAKVVTILTYYASSLVWIFRSTLWTLFAIKLYTNCPKKLERFSILILIGTILQGVIPSFNVFTTLIPPGLGINEFLEVIGFGLIAIIFLFKPDILFLTSNKTSRLAVINNDGTLLFSHHWISEKDDSASADIVSILKQSLQYENISEIHLEKSVLVINRQNNISFILVTVKSSQFLKKTLNTFSEKFMKKFENILPNTIDKEKDHREAATLVLDCFQFLPTYT